MYLFTECWKAKDEWLELDKKSRNDYMQELGKGVAELVKAGVEIITWSMNDCDITKRAPYDYFAIWKFPNKAFAQQFELIIEQSGWYKYFDQLNMGGEIGKPDESISHMIELNTKAEQLI